MQSASPQPAMIRPESVEAALDALARPGAVAVAGASWVMRASLRHETPAPVWVVLGGITEMHAVTTTQDALRIGALVTHERLAATLADAPDLRALAQAAGHSANPGVRRIATLGGNLCARGFAPADLVPALLALDASVEIATPAGRKALPMGMFLARRDSFDPVLVTAVTVPRAARHSAHRRLLIRRAGDYPVALLSVSVETAPDGRIARARIAVGAVEQVARRWTSLEAAVRGQLPDPVALSTLAGAHVHDFTPRDGMDAPGWYRLRVLPTLVRQAFEQINTEGQA